MTTAALGSVRRFGAVGLAILDLTPLTTLVCPETSGLLLLFPDCHREHSSLRRSRGQGSEKQPLHQRPPRSMPPSFSSVFFFSTSPRPPPPLRTRLPGEKLMRRGRTGWPHPGVRRGPPPPCPSPSVRHGLTPRLLNWARTREAARAGKENICPSPPRRVEPSCLRSVLGVVR
jgi:hypothetical protein